ncbi:blue copper protein-like [Cornus florida]|uniref:blue copper protein-like n=1 Tax=Cornus florida TaxID=4283 RepID=UPI002896D17F|nr:blue copper protein-like [Cornus florida]
MATKMSLAIMLVLAAALLHTTVAQTTHVVGDSLGWIVPPGGPIAYSTWADMYTFTVGDILVFNFTTGQQDVARVSKEQFSTCNSTNPIWHETTGPANITLTSAGEYYFIGTMDTHCYLGQKLAINVTGTSGPTASPAPPPPPPATPAPASPRAPVTYVVGDDLGWIVPPGGSVAYAAWAYNKTFIVGDTLEFNFKNGTQDVAVVTKAAYATCNTTNTTTVLTTSPARFTLTAAGEYYFTSTYSRHCEWGQQLAINVIASSSATPPSHSPPPPPATPVPAPPRSPVAYVVGDDLGWIVPPGGSVAYTAWAYNKTFMVGDTLVFNFVNGTQDVAKVTKAVYETCDTNNTISVLTTSPAKITLTTAGEHYFTSTYARHCALGQQLAINVIASSTATSPSSSATAPSGTTTPSSSPVPPSAEGPSSLTAPPPVSSAMSVAVHSFSITSLSIVIAFLLN